MKPLVLSLLLCISLSSWSQSDPHSRIYHVVDYMVVEPGEEAEYLQLELIWKKIHAARLEAGTLKSWHLARVISPSGSDQPYNFITRNTLQGDQMLAKFYEKDMIPANWESLLTEEEIEMVMRTEEIRSLVKTEVWATIESIWDDDQLHSINVFNYFDIPEGKYRADHVKTEKDIWLPLHEARIRDQEMTGWTLLGMVMPFGEHVPYHDATVDSYANMEQYLATQNYSMDEFRSRMKDVHPSKDVEKLFAKTNAVCTLVKGEVRMTIDRLPDAIPRGEN